jgi:hypothetical protein
VARSVSLKNTIHGLANSAHQAFQTYLKNLSASERNASGSYSTWAAKDTLAHVTYWEHRGVEVLSYLSRGEMPPEYPSFEQVNLSVYEENRETTFPAIQRNADQTLGAIRTVLERFSDNALQEPGYSTWRGGKPLLGYALHVFYIHPMWHLGLAYLKLGDSPQTKRLQEVVEKTVLELDTSDEMRASLAYDAACLAQLTGDSDHALVRLKEAVSLRPELALSAQEDPDFSGLQRDPRFVTITAG